MTRYEKRRDAFIQFCESIGQPLHVPLDARHTPRPDDSHGAGIAARLSRLLSIQARIKLARDAGLVNVLLDGVTFADLEHWINVEVADESFHLRAWIEAIGSPSPSA